MPTKFKYSSPKTKSLVKKMGKKKLTEALRDAGVLGKGEKLGAGFLSFLVKEAVPMVGQLLGSMAEKQGGFMTGGRYKGMSGGKKLSNDDLSGGFLGALLATAVPLVANLFGSLFGHHGGMMVGGMLVGGKSGVGPYQEVHKAIRGKYRPRSLGSLTASGGSKKPRWIDYVKCYASEHGITYKEAMSAAAPSYHKFNESGSKGKANKSSKKKKTKKPKVVVYDSDNSE